ncbi:MAG TPA: TonB family protein [Pyrinomonadaceae bacterium]|nr:TonB family protein [Pyrinomonadaceae bacterium]
MPKVIYLSFLRTLMIAAIVISIAASSVFSQTPTPSPNPALAPVVELIRVGDFEKALKLLKQAVKENKTDGEAWYYLGIVYLQTSELNKAADAFQKAVEVRPDLAAQAQGSYAYALVLRNRLDSAAVAANKALEIDPNHIEALYTLAIVELRKGAREEAIKRADSIIALKPDYAAAYLLKSQAYVSYTAGGLYRNANKSKDEQLSSYRSAAEPLQTYLQLETDPRAAQQWTEQLDTLRLIIGERPGDSPIYKGADVTTKAKLISKPEPTYTQAARKDQIGGTVVLRCVFAADGTVRHILVVQSPHNDLTESSIAAAKQIQFVPAKLNGKPVSMWMQLEYNYNLY